MIHFLRYYSLEIYTVISMIVMAYAWVINTDTIQAFAVIAILLWILHEREESYYPWWFATNVIWKITGFKDNLTPEIVRYSRVVTSIYLMVLTFVPFFCSNHAWLIIPAWCLGIFEWIVHIVFIYAARLKKPYSPWMITAEIELILSIWMFYYLISNNLVEPIHFLYGFLIMIWWYIWVQYNEVHLVWFKYRELPKRMKENIKRIRAEIKAEKENKKK